MFVTLAVDSAVAIELKDVANEDVFARNAAPVDCVPVVGCTVEAKAGEPMVEMKERDWRGVCEESDIVVVRSNQYGWPASWGAQYGAEASFGSVV